MRLDGKKKDGERHRAIFQALGHSTDCGFGMKFPLFSQGALRDSSFPTIGAYLAQKGFSKMYRNTIPQERGSNDVEASEVLCAK